MSTECSCRETTVNGCPAVVLENDRIAVTVLPDKGGDIYSLVSKPHGIDLLWKSPWQVRAGQRAPTGAPNESEWLDRYEGGWQVIFPNGGDACTYRGAPLGFHGEASISAWDCRIWCAGPDTAAVALTLALRRSPFIISRTLSIERYSTVVRIAEAIENVGAIALHYMWGHHPAFGRPFLDGCRLQLAGGRFLAHDTEISPLCRVRAGASGTWPLMEHKAGGTVDLSIVPPAGEHVTEFGYITDLTAGWYGMVNFELNLSFGFAWPLETFPYLWFWQELGGSLEYPWYGRCSVMAVEPFTSIPGAGLERAIAAGTAPILEPGGRAQAEFAAVLFEAGTVDSITPAGEVRMR